MTNEAGIERLREVFAAGSKRYELRHLLGQGGVGAVFAAYDRDLDAEVAIKVLFPDILETEPLYVARFRQEVRIARKIKHENIAPIFDIAEAGPLHFVSMELVAGESLAERLDRVGRLNEAATIPVLEQIARGLDAAHGAGVVHRDLKPQNVMLTPEGKVVILDFGMARHLPSPQLTQTGFVTGTPAYMAPEQILEEPVDGRADVYAAAMVAWECLTGNLPFQRDTALSTMEAQLDDPLPANDLAEARVSPELAAILVKCLEKKPEARYETGKALAEELRKLQRERRLTRPLSPPRAPSPRPRRRVLLADDEAEVRSEVAARLSRAGYDVDLARDGAQALERLLERQPDVLVLDEALPVMDGLDVLRVVKANGATTRVPVILLSSVMGKSHHAFALAAGAVAVIARPLDLDALLAAVDRTGSR